MRYWDVTGAGRIGLSHGSNHQCGNDVGFSLCVSWGRNGEVGGVIGAEEARDLAFHILRILTDRRAVLADKEGDDS